MPLAPASRMRSDAALPAGVSCMSCAAAVSAPSDTARPARTVACQVRKVLGRELAAGHLAQIVVDVGGGDIVPAPAAAVGEQSVAAAAAFEAADDRAHLVLGHRLFLKLAGLAGVGEDDLPAGNGHLLAADGRQAEALVLGRVFLPAGRKKPRSISWAAAASTRSRTSPRSPRCQRITLRGRGRAAPNSSIRSCLSRSFGARK
jgi:hypothetical protein